MKTTYPHLSRPPRLSSDQSDPSHLITSIASPHLNLYNPLRKSTDIKEPKQSLAYVDIHMKKQQAGPLKDLLSSSDSKGFETQKRGHSTKYDSEKNKLLRMDLSNKADDPNGIGPLSEVLLKECLNKRLSIDSTNDAASQKGLSYLRPKYSNPDLAPSNYIQKQQENYPREINYGSKPTYSLARDTSKAVQNRGVVYSSINNTGGSSKAPTMRKDSGDYDGNVLGSIVSYFR